MRLRFLKTVAPGPQATPQEERRGRRFAFLVLAALAGALAVSLILAAVSSSRLRASAPIRKTRPHMDSTALAAKLPSAPEVWLVEKSGEQEAYSNGLRIDSHFLAPTHPRHYLAFPAEGGSPETRTEPVGIVFHTTESRQAPFEARENEVLKKLGESILEYVRRKQAYNFLIDRFGRVYRVVAEDQAANHAGYSVWADESGFYINLNESFLGISFEAVSSLEPAAEPISPAQARSAGMLVEMLRSRYRLRASNCVTHAQVSVNPANMRAGLHLDWASGFPFEKLGLPDNYAAALPSVWAFGFEYDPGSRAGAGAAIAAGIERALANIDRRAAAAGIEPAAYRKRLQQRYRQMLAEVRKDLPDPAAPQ